MKFFSSYDVVPFSFPNALVSVSAYIARIWEGEKTRDRTGKGTVVWLGSFSDAYAEGGGFLRDLWSKSPRQ